MDEFAQLIWDELRKVACTTGLKACRIVILSPSDVEQAAAKIKLALIAKAKEAKEQSNVQR